MGKPFNKNSKYIGEYHDIVVEGGMPAIISKDTFNLAQAEMERRRTRKAPKSPKAEYLLAGRLFCGHCKGPMQGVSGKSGNTRGKNKTCDKKQVSRGRLYCPLYPSRRACEEGTRGARAPKRYRLGDCLLREEVHCERAAGYRVRRRPCLRACRSSSKRSFWARLASSSASRLQRTRFSLP